MCPLPPVALGVDRHRAIGGVALGRTLFVVVATGRQFDARSLVFGRIAII